MKILDIVKDLVFPQGLYCNCCGKYTDGKRSYGLCDHCIRHMTFETERICFPDDCHVREGMAAIKYGLYEKRLIFSLKYNGKTYIAPVLAQIMYDAMLSELADKRSCRLLKADLIVPVPISRERLKERGFNQMERVGQHLARLSGIPMEDRILKRIRETKAQRALSPMERKNNMKNAFSIDSTKAICLQGKKILLIDDIYTTGATASECCRVMAEAGAEEIYFLAVMSANKKEKVNMLKNSVI